MVVLSLGKCSKQIVFFVLNIFSYLLSAIFLFLNIIVIVI